MEAIGIPGTLPGGRRIDEKERLRRRSDDGVVIAGRVGESGQHVIGLSQTKTGQTSYGLEYLVPELRLTFEQPVQGLLIDGQHLKWQSRPDGCGGEPMIQKRHLPEEKALAERRNQDPFPVLVLFVDSHFSRNEEVYVLDRGVFEDDIVPFLPLPDAAERAQQFPLMVGQIRKKWDFGERAGDHH